MWYNHSSVPLSRFVGAADVASVRRSLFPGFALFPCSAFHPRTIERTNYSRRALSTAAVPARTYILEIGLDIVTSVATRHTYVLTFSNCYSCTSSVLKLIRGRASCVPGLCFEDAHALGLDYWQMARPHHHPFT